MSIEFANLKLASITPSLTNPRKTFNPDKLSELAHSIKATGMHQPILVRPLAGSRVADTDRAVQFELVCGERRLRASQQAGLDTVPAMVRVLTDDQVLEIQLVENLQRDDLTAIEEAEGYDALMQHASITADQVGEKIGKSRSYVYGRLKLLDLSETCKQAMREGGIDASRALLIARIPDTALQTKALAEAMRKDFHGDVSSVRTFNNWLQVNVMLRLEAAKFSVHDSQLVIGVGNCTSCPKRTGANPDLFADVQGADICTDPACFHQKEEAHRGSVLDTAAKRGMALIEGEDAQDICSQYGARLNGYSPLTQERTDTTDGQSATLGQLLGKDLPGAVLIENPWTKELIAAVPTEEAEAMLLARGLVKAPQAKAASKDDLEYDIKDLRNKVTKDTTKLFRKMAFKRLADEVHAMQIFSFQMMPGLMRAWWLRQVDGELAPDDLANYFNLKLTEPKGLTGGALYDAQETQVRLHVQACDSDQLYKAMTLYLLEDDISNAYYTDAPDPTLLEALASEIEVDLDDIETAAAIEIRENYADELKTLTAKLKAQTKGTDIAATGYRGPNGETWSGRGLMPRWLAVLVKDGQDKEQFRITPPTPTKPPTTQAPAAQAKGDGGAKKPKIKTTAAQAKAQIAAAMQAQETNPGATAQGNLGDSSQPVATSTAYAAGVAQAVDYAVGQKVRITTDDDKLGIVARKWSGKVGTVTRREPGGGYWDVTFKGRNGGIALFARDQLQVLEEVPA